MIKIMLPVHRIPPKYDNFICTPSPEIGHNVRRENSTEPISDATTVDIKYFS